MASSWPLMSDARSLDRIDQPLQVPQARDVGIGHQQDVIGELQRRRRRHDQGGADVEDHIVVDRVERAQRLLDGIRFAESRAAELVAGGQHVHATLVLDNVA